MHPVYLVDDDEAVRLALELLLSTVKIQVTSFADPIVFFDQMALLKPGCLVLDIRMPKISGLKLQEQLINNGMDWPIIVISGHGDIEACRRAFKNGAVDFLSKPIDENDLIDAIYKGQKVLTQRLRQEAEQKEIQSLLSNLTPREAEVLESVAKGYTTREIAQSLHVSPRTIESHRAAIGAKLGTTSQAEMTRFWLECSAVSVELPS